MNSLEMKQVGEAIMDGFQEGIPARDIHTLTRLEILKYEAYSWPWWLDFIWVLMPKFVEWYINKKTDIKYRRYIESVVLEKYVGRIQAGV